MTERGNDSERTRREGERERDKQFDRKDEGGRGHTTFVHCNDGWIE